MKFLKRFSSILLTAGIFFNLAFLMTSCDPDLGTIIGKNYSPVTDLSVTPGYKCVTLNWTNPNDDEFSSIRIKYGTNEKSLSNDKEYTAETTNTSVSGLNNSTKYFFKVYAIYSDSDNTEVASQIKSTTTVTPAAVTNLKANANGTDTITITWTNQTGDFYKSKKIFYGTDSSNLNQKLTINDNTTTTATLTDLNSATKYYIKVTTILSDNDEVSSEVINTKTKTESSGTEETGTDLTNLSSVEFAKALTIGWNLGNTLDAPTETGWGMPKTTQAMIDTVAAAGFKTIRIPVSWSTHVSGSNYTVDSAWMSRVKEVVDYAVNDDLYIILNMHHDIYNTSDILSQSGYALSDKSNIQTKSKEYISKVWTQIATEFKDYDSKLIFEVLNEPRDKDGKWYGNEWWTSQTDMIAVITDYEQSGVDAIRAVSGNENRFIMVPGYAGSGSDSGMLDRYTMPTDTADDKLLLSAHAYSPYNFAMNNMEDTTFDSSDAASLSSIFYYLKTHYTEKGIGVVMGEASASDKNNTSERIKWVNDYYTKAKDAGIPVILWDNQVIYPSSNPAENHGYLYRTAGKWFFPTIIQAMMDTVGVTKTVSGAAISIPEYVAPAAQTAESIGWDSSKATKLSDTKWSLDWSSDHYVPANSSAKEGSILKIELKASGTSFRMINSDWKYSYNTGTIVNGSASGSDISSSSTDVYYVLTAADAAKFNSDKIVFAGNSGTITSVYFQE